MLLEISKCKETKYDSKTFIESNQSSSPSALVMALIYFRAATAADLLGLNSLASALRCWASLWVKASQHRSNGHKC